MNVDTVTADILKQAVGLGAIAVVIPAVESVKARLDAPGWLWPVLALVFAWALNVAVAWAMDTSIQSAIVVGAIAGFGAMAAYDKVDKAIPHG